MAGIRNKWNPEYFRDQLGDKEVRVAGEKPTLRQFLESVIFLQKKSLPHYLNEVNIHNDFRSYCRMWNHFILCITDRLMTPFLARYLRECVKALLNY
ncbi:MAG: hypothetical protein IPL74_19030 [Bacteroidetes bacterium]|nr:hypothetical protein [Bacteroidota bacterium]